MRIMGRIILAVILIVGTLAAVSYLLPGTVVVSRSTDISASPERIFPAVNDLRRFNEWQPWAARDPKMRHTFSGPGAGVGAQMVWSSEQFGEGRMEIMKSDPPGLVVVALDFGTQGRAMSQTTLTPRGDATRVTWSMTSELGLNPLSRWMGLMLGGWIGEDYERGLVRLKRLVETGGAE